MIEIIITNKTTGYSYHQPAPDIKLSDKQLARFLRDMIKYVIKMAENNKK